LLLLRAAVESADFQWLYNLWKQMDALTLRVDRWEKYSSIQLTMNQTPIAAQKMNTFKKDLQRTL
jgi:hypothetical protein